MTEPASWADKTPDQILADVEQLLTIGGESFPVVSLSLSVDSQLPTRTEKLLGGNWPGQVSIVMPLRAHRVFRRVMESMERRRMSRRAWFRLRGRRKAAQRQYRTP